MAYTFEDMLHFASEAFGPLGIKTVRAWAALNARWFGGALRPVPLIITQAMPYGRRVAFCSYGGDKLGGRTITVNVPREGEELVADNGVLLHEMVHQYLFERGEDPAHASHAWRREIMRLTSEMTGRKIWAGKSQAVRVDGKVVRMNLAHQDGRASLGQSEIARWPHGQAGIALGALGTTIKAKARW
jgi:hypothetical protein